MEEGIIDLILLISGVQTHENPPCLLGRQPNKIIEVSSNDMKIKKFLLLCDTSMPSFKPSINGNLYSL